MRRFRLFLIGLVGCIKWHGKELLKVLHNDFLLKSLPLTSALVVLVNILFLSSFLEINTKPVADVKIQSTRVATSTPKVWVGCQDSVESPPVFTTFLLYPTRETLMQVDHQVSDISVTVWELQRVGDYGQNQNLLRIHTVDPKSKLNLTINEGVIAVAISPDPGRFESFIWSIGLNQLADKLYKNGVLVSDYIQYSWSFDMDRRYCSKYAGMV